MKIYTRAGFAVLSILLSLPALADGQAVSAHELLDNINNDGHIGVYITFDTGKATINHDALAQIDQIAEMMRNELDLKLEITGQTDKVGTPESNQKLSEERAKAVVRALIARGVPAKRLVAKSHTQPSTVANKPTEVERAKD